MQFLRPLIMLKVLSGTTEDMLIMQDHFSPNDSGLENASEASKSG